MHPARLADWSIRGGEGGGGGLQCRRDPRSIRGCRDKAGDPKLGLRFILGVSISFRTRFVGMLR